jgi:hypothetical protein
MQYYMRRWRENAAWLRAMKRYWQRALGLIYL